MKSVSTRLFAFFALALVVPAADKSADRPPVDAQLLEHAEYPCVNCFFGNSDYYFCLKADNKVLIGHNKIPVVNWNNADQNGLTKIHKGWMPWQSEGATVKIKYDDKYIWLPRANGKDVRLKQDYNKDIFMMDPQCRAAVKKKPTN